MMSFKNLLRLLVYAICISSQKNTCAGGAGVLCVVRALR